MNWTVILKSEELTDYDGFLHKAESNTFECPFEYFQEVWYVYFEQRLFRKNRWVVARSRVTEVWATNCFGVGLQNGLRIPDCEFDRLFEDKESAIDFCIKKNMQSKVKVYNC